METNNKKKKGRRRRRHTLPEAEIITELVTEQEKAMNQGDFKTIPSSITQVLMVEVDNVAHDPFKSTEEVKVKLAEVIFPFQIVRQCRVCYMSVSAEAQR